MCWRDDVPMTRRCISCGATYYGDLGHRGCPGRPKEKNDGGAKDKDEAAGRDPVHEA